MQVNNNVYRLTMPITEDNKEKYWHQAIHQLLLETGFFKSRSIQPPYTLINRFGTWTLNTNTDRTIQLLSPKSKYIELSEDYFKDPNKENTETEAHYILNTIVADNYIIILDYLFGVFEPDVFVESRQSLNGDYNLAMDNGSLEVAYKNTFCGIIESPIDADYVYHGIYIGKSDSASLVGRMDWPESAAYPYIYRSRTIDDSAYLVWNSSFLSDSEVVMKEQLKYSEDFPYLVLHDIYGCILQTEKNKCPDTFYVGSRKFMTISSYKIQSNEHNRFKVVAFRL